MTYFGFLARFLGVPLVILAVLTYLDWRRGRQLPPRLHNYAPAWVIAAHVVVAVVYTTPWDNYLVATRVWWYDPALVTGIVFGWVPLEEYTFFVLQTIMTGMWLLWLAKRIDAPARFTPQQMLRWWTAGILGLLWLAAAIILFSPWRAGTYLGLELIWALPPSIFQLGFGADILWHHRKLVLAALLPATVYLCVGDAIAIGSGTWTIDPAQSTGWLVGTLPIEEAIFFLVTNTLVVFGITLVMSAESHDRVPASVRRRLSTMRRHHDHTPPLEA